MDEKRLSRALRSVGDDWTQGLLPSPTRTRNEEQLIASDMFTAALPTANELADAADLRLPGARALGIMLAAYVVVAGPIVFLLVRRVHRGQLAWVAIPLLAVGSTGVVFTTGSSLRRSLSSAQVTVYETGPSGTVATTWSLLANKQGGDVGVTLPDGWVAGGSIDDVMAFVLPGPIIRGDGDDIAMAEGDKSDTFPVEVHLERNRVPRGAHRVVEHEPASAGIKLGVTYQALPVGTAKVGEG